MGLLAAANENVLDRGSIGRYHEAMTGKTGEQAAKEAMMAQLLAIDDASKYLTETGEEISGRYDILSEALPAAWEYMMASATPEGLAQNIQDIRTSGLYDEILGERMDTMGKGLSRAGLSRSSYGGRRYADLSTDALMGLEGMLTGRQGKVAGIGYDALGRQVGLDTNLMNQLANLKLQKGGVRAGGVLGEAEAIAKGAQNQYTAMHNVGSGLMGMFGGMMGGGSDIPSTTATSTSQGGQQMPGQYTGYNQGGYNPMQTQYWDQPIMGSGWGGY